MVSGVRAVRINPVNFGVASLVPLRPLIIHLSSGLGLKDRLARSVPLPRALYPRPRLSPGNAGGQTRHLRTTLCNTRHYGRHGTAQLLNSTVMNKDDDAWTARDFVIITSPLPAAAAAIGDCKRDAEICKSQMPRTGTCLAYRTLDRVGTFHARSRRASTLSRFKSRLTDRIVPVTRSRLGTVRVY